MSTIPIGRRGKVRGMTPPPQLSGRGKFSPGVMTKNLDVFFQVNNVTEWGPKCLLILFLQVTQVLPA